MSSRIKQLTDLGQSLWYDDMGRRILDSGELAEMIERGDIRGLTSNPSIFNQAIAKSKDYDSALIPMSWAGYGDRDILEQLMVEDIQRVADLLLPLFLQTQGGDGFVSLEVRPDYAYDTQRTITEAKRLWDIVKRPNLMIKIPATRPGLAAIHHSIAAGINVNITLIFSLDRYKEVMEAYLSGLEARIKAEKEIKGIHSVASFFISRIDTKVDRYLEAIIQPSELGAQIARSLLGKIAIANARLAYQEFQKVFNSDRYYSLQAQGASLQRPLWASTSTKNPTYSDTMYVDELIGAFTVNTVPPQTLDAFRDHGRIGLTIEKNLDEAQKNISDLEAVGISMQKVTRELEEEGVNAFSHAFDSLLASVKQRREFALDELGVLQAAVSKRVTQFQLNNFSKRFHSKDASLWSSDAEGQQEISRRMGWLSSPTTSWALLPDLHGLVSDIKNAGYQKVLLLGMGGSSLAPEVLSLIYGQSVSGLKLTILDSTDPGQVLQAARNHPITSTLFIVSSKSGSTAEVNALSDYFWERAKRAVGEKAADHFVAITDPGTKLGELALERKFRKIVLADPEVGGRYSALTAFGLVPAALMGINIEEYLRYASRMAFECGPEQIVGRNPGFVLGIVLGEAFNQQKEKLSFIADPELAALGSWFEQLIAESSGKQGKGIVPVHGEPLGSTRVYGTDRIFVYLRRSGKFDRKINILRKAGHMIITLDIADNASLGAEFYKWEVAISTACAIIGVNPFDQPNVQDSKNRTFEKIRYFKTHRSFNMREPELSEQGLHLYTDQSLSGTSIIDSVKKFLASGKSGDYIAINAFLKRDKKVEITLQHLRLWIRANTRLATTLGFGPRYLHSTGQLHKGGRNNGIFLLFTADPLKDIQIPGEGLTFGTLEHGQALGDLEALKASGRRILHIHLEDPSYLTRFVNQIKLG